MTAVFMGSMDRLGVEASLVDRRFSADLGQVGHASFGKLVRAIGLFSRLRQAAKVKRPDYGVVFVTNRPGSFLVDCAVVAILRMYRVPIIHYVHTTGFSKLASRGHAWKQLVRAVLSSADTVVTLGPSLADDIAQWVKPAQMCFIQNIPHMAPSSISPANQGGPIIFLSNLIREKGADTFVQAASILAAKVDHQFVIAGGEPDDEFSKELRALVDALSLGSRVRFLGHLDSNSKWQLLRDCAMLVFPSRYPFEAQPLTLVEARHVGVPTVATDVGGIRDLVDESGWLTLDPIGTSESIAQAVLAKLSESPPRYRTGDNGRQWTSVYDQAWLSVLTNEPGDGSKCRSDHQVAGRTTCTERVKDVDEDQRGGKL
ncbi:glycosyltransferase family 4 protein [Gordonia sp. YY1]|uniref:glycosyltransferase family 4 protein n=1 Tax=Gordonia sp. YY1 TaxID=396712 RepID=UPI00133173AC|nr:glycosyltransferase family 4 protein [Gordonia sp. YY1]